MAAAKTRWQNLKWKYNTDNVNRPAIHQSEYNTVISRHLTCICESQLFSIFSVSQQLHIYLTFNKVYAAEIPVHKSASLVFLLRQLWQNSHQVGLITFYGATCGSRKIQMLKKWFLSQAYKCFSTFNTEVLTSVMLKILCS